MKTMTCKSVQTMESISLRLLKLSKHRICNTLFQFHLEDIKFCLILVILALSVQVQHVNCTPNDQNFASHGGDFLENNNQEFRHQIQDTEKGKTRITYDYSREAQPKNYQTDFDYRNFQSSVELMYDDQYETMGPNNEELPTNLSPHNPGGLPMISDGAFSLVTMIYVTIIFLFVFFAFCWKNNYPKDGPKGDSRGKAKKTCTITESDEKPVGGRPEQIDMKQIITTYDYQSNEKLER